MSNLRFPTAGSTYTDTQEGGMYVLAIVRHKNAAADNTYCNAGHLSTSDVCVSHPQYSNYRGAASDLWVISNDYVIRSVNLIASVRLDMTDSSWHNEEDGYFVATFDDLTDQGCKIVEALSALGQVELVTFLDT